MRKPLALVLAMTMTLAACSEGNDSADVGDRDLVRPRSLAGNAAPPSGTEVIPETVARGTGAEAVAGSPGGTRIVEDPEAWRATWDQLRTAEGNRPDIYFANAKVVVIARQVNSGGHRLHPARMVAQGDRVQVTLEVAKPGPGCMTTSAVEALWVAVRVPYWVTGADVQEQPTTGVACS